MTYQRENFVTPPFGGYVSGHSTFSRAAAEALTLLTGDPFFPWGLGEFHFKAGEYLRHEYGPSADITLQWARYIDASDQCGLSRIWGGIHPPIDDVPGRKIGKIVGSKSFNLATTFFYADKDNDGFLSLEDCDDNDALINPNTVWYKDADGDLFVSDSDSLVGCEIDDTLYIVGFKALGLDCDDTNANINVKKTYFADIDHDLYINPHDTLVICGQPDSLYILESEALGVDCDDTNTLLNPNSLWFADADGDGYINGQDSLIQCAFTSGYILWTDSLQYDCNDADITVHPNAIEIANNNMMKIVMVKTSFQVLKMEFH